MAEAMPTNVQKNCSRCGESFSCMQENGCWCASLRLESAILAELRARYTDCLCEDCLRKLAVPQQ